MNAPVLTLVAGEHYRLRDGTRVGPLERLPQGDETGFVWRARDKGGDMLSFQEDGRYLVSALTSKYDIVRCCRRLGRVTPIDEMTLDQYRRGAAVVLGRGWA